MSKYQSFDAVSAIESNAYRGQNKICIATQDYLFLVKNGGIGTSFHHTACILSERGYDVTVLYCNHLDNVTATQLQHAEAETRKFGIKLEYLFPRNFGVAGLQEFFPPDIITVSSYAAYHILKGRNFDLILFPDWRGLGFYSLQAKKQGLAFRNTALWVQTHSTSLWHALSNEQPGFSEDDTRVFHMEREAVAMADVVVSPTRYLLDWKVRHGFRLPERTFVQPLLLTDVLGTCPTSRKRVERITELVFFGRLEKRKGLHIFVQAVRRLIRERYDNKAPSYLTVSFLGKMTEIDGRNSYEYAKDALAATGVKLRFLTSLDATEAVRYLKGDGRLAVLPSVADNSPMTVLECIHNEIPFIAAERGGIPEIICADDHPAVLFRLGVRTLSEKLSEVLTGGATTAFPAVLQEERNIPSWLGAITASIAEQRAAAAARVPQDEGALVSVCITHFNRPHMLKITIDGLVAQSHRNFEVIIVDDGSTMAEANEYLQELERGDLPFPVTLIRQRNEFVGAARNKGLARARGEYVVFMDDDNFAHPDQLRVFLSAIAHGGYDALTCAAVAFPETQDPRALDTFIHIFLPLGNGLSPNLFMNGYGDANGIFRTAFLRDLGGFTEDEDLSWEDYELFSKIEVNGGRIGVVPEPLLYLRNTTGSVSRRGSQLANCYRALRPALGALPWGSFGDAVLVALSATLRRNAPLTDEQRARQAVTERHLIASTEFSITNLRWLVHRMVERDETETAISTLMDHYQSSPMFAFSFLECFSLCIERGMTLDMIQARMGRTAELQTLIQAMADATLDWDIESLQRFLIEKMPEVLSTIDGQLMLAKTALMSGDVVNALLLADKAFCEVEAGYLRRNTDIRQAVEAIEARSLLNRLPVRSGLQHWFLHGHFEGRILDYCRPVASPFALYQNPVLHNYVTRISDAEDLGIEERGNLYAQLLFECIENNTPISFADLSSVILRDANTTYLRKYRDVEHEYEGDSARKGIEHYNLYGRDEGRDCILRTIESRNFLLAYEQFRMRSREKLLARGPHGQFRFHSSFAGSLAAPADAPRGAG